MKFTDEYLQCNFGIDKRILELVSKSEKKIEHIFGKYEDICAYNQYKVLDAFQKNGVSDRHFNWNTGYGYDDIGREVTEKVFAEVFKAEKAIVRTQIVNGTHALSLILSGILRPGDEIIYISGKPYDTLEEVIGIRGNEMGSLSEFGITYKEVPLKNNKLDFTGIKKAISDKTKMVTLQRATGYSWRKAIEIDDIENAVQEVKAIDDKIVFMVDNCYGEFLDILEPTEIGADVMAGSLIKNPGGGLALSGGYIVGKSQLIDKIMYRLTCPGIGGECGLTFGQTRNILQGIFMAPNVVKGAIKGAILCGEVYSQLGYDTCPKTGDARSDIIQGIKFLSEEKVIGFCQGVQEAAPIDSFVKPEPWDMPGYDTPVIMAAGAFIQGSSIELSADAPIREPYIAYFQGGLSYEHSKFGIIKSLDNLYKKGLLDLK
ncbi:MAG: methionine gamma-lyase family protein [[Eubacterium] brachy]|nr:methionine gamma-lyase family protein [[Eubacterium] brachy]